MPLTAGIVGLPNVGKSTLFNAITNSQVEAANYPFATIAPNVGVVSVPDARVDYLCTLFQPKKVIYPTFEFTDIAGLVKGASQGEGLGNQFLAHIREVDAICHIVRCFDDPKVIHVEQNVDPLRDIEIVNLELILADLATLDHRLEKVTRKTKTQDKAALKELASLEKAKQHLLTNQTLRSLDKNETDNDLYQSLHLLTSKPVIYIANLAEDTIVAAEKNSYYQAVQAFAEKDQSPVIAIAAQIEAELVALPSADRQAFLADFGIKQSGLDQIILSCYDLLDLATFFTVGKPEVHAWTFTKGMKAPTCASIIHSDFEKGFIRAETYSYSELVQYGSELAVKEAGKLRLEGKDYQVKDGDILHFRFNV